MNFHFSEPKYAATGCLPNLLRRLLRPHHHRITKPDEEPDELHCANDTRVSPGIVAKLMGLDSMPQSPDFVEIENEEFIILSFEKDDKGKKTGLKQGRIHMGLGEFSEKRRKTKNQEMPSLEIDGGLEVWGVEKLCDKRRRSGKKKKELLGSVERFETEFDSENSSPVSVLDFVDFPVDQEAQDSGNEDSKPKNSNLRRNFTRDVDKVAPSPSNMMKDGVESSGNGQRCIGSKKIKNFGEIWGEVYRLIEKDKDVIDARVQWKGGDFGEIAGSFELEILDQLVMELVEIFRST